MRMMAVKIRKGREDDFKDAIGLWRGFFPEDTARFVRKYMNERTSNGELLVAEEAGKVVGFLAFKKDYFHEADYNQIVIVSREHRRKGIATELMKQFELQARSRKRMRIYSSAEPWNKESFRMHKKLGYERCGYLDHIWGEGKRDVFFTKVIGK